jgi:hypothetical protein
MILLNSGSGKKKENSEADPYEKSLVDDIETTGYHDAIIFKFKRQKGNLYYIDANQDVLLHLHHNLLHEWGLRNLNTPISDHAWGIRAGLTDLPGIPKLHICATDAKHFRQGNHGFLPTRGRDFPRR